MSFLSYFFKYLLTYKSGTMEVAIMPLKLTTNKNYRTYNSNL